jgi:hypothetical protein
MGVSPTPTHNPTTQTHEERERKNMRIHTRTEINVKDLSVGDRIIAKYKTYTVIRISNQPKTVFLAEDGALWNDKAKSANVNTLRGTIDMRSLNVSNHTIQEWRRTGTRRPESR